jgi:hypothetical protein
MVSTISARAAGQSQSAASKSAACGEQRQVSNHPTIQVLVAGVLAGPGVATLAWAAAPTVPVAPSTKLQILKG